MIKKILYVGSKYEYNIKANGEALNKKAFHDNFKHLGYEVTAIWYEYDYPDLQLEIIKMADNFKPDLVFFVLQKDQVKTETLERLKAQGHFTVNWFGDDHWRFENFTSKFAKCFSACLTTHKFSIDKYLQLGQTNVIRSEWASLASSVDYRDLEYRYDVSFIGGASAYRKWFVKELGSRGINVNCFGSRWPQGRIEDKEMEAIFSSSRINLGISNSTQYDIRYLISHPKNFVNTIRNPKSGSHVKARNFEIPMHGGFQLTEYAPCLEDYFRIGKEVACYREIDDAELLIKYYLNHEDEREAIRDAGVERARKSNSFTHRIIHFMRQLDELTESRKSGN